MPGSESAIVPGSLLFIALLLPGMSLKEQLSIDLKEAMKHGRAGEVAVLRMVLSAVHNKEIEKGAHATLDDASLQRVALGEAQKCREAALAFDAGGRADLARKERSELALLQKYLPQELSGGEIRKEVDRIIREGSIKEFGPAMKATMAVLRGRAPAAVVQEAVKKSLGARQ